MAVLFILALIVSAPALADDANTTGLAVTDDTVTVGILHSLTGTVAINEASVIDAEKMAIEEINAGGGVLGRQIKVIVQDGASDWPTFAEKANLLLNKDKVAVVFGCYTSASRKAVLPVFEKSKGLLYYPTYYEGLEASPNIFYTAQEATQQNMAAVEWLIKDQGKKTFYIIGSDYIWPRTSNKIAINTIKKLGGKVLAEEYYPLGHTQFGSVINKMKPRNPTSSSAPWWAAATFLSINSSGPPASPEKRTPSWRWRFRKKKCAPSAPERGRRLHLHGLFSESGQPGQQEVRESFQGQIRRRPRDRRRYGMRLHLPLSLEDGGGKGQEL